MNPQFPPVVEVGNRVWTDGGYPDHGPIDGSKTDIAPNMGGTIIGTVKPYLTMDHLLYTVRWDNGQVSKHYDKNLFCIGNFSTRAEFEAAIELDGAIELTIGPQGGFREARMRLKYGASIQEVHLHRGDRELWVECLEPLAKRMQVKINTIKLPPAKRRGGLR
jgi:hypothetical protein